MVNHLMYADDCELFSPSSADLQQLLNVCSGHGELQNMKYNEAKGVISRTTENKRLASSDFKLPGQVLKPCSQVKYQGHVITDALTDDKDSFWQCHKRMFFAVNLVNGLMRPS